MSVVHGDLALENILVDGRGFVKIIDFGFSYRVGEVARGGTITYAPSEVITFVQDSSPPPQTPQCCDGLVSGCGAFPLALWAPALCGSQRLRGGSILRGSYHFPTWTVISEASQDLVDLFVQVDPRCRIALSDVSAHLVPSGCAL